MWEKQPWTRLRKLHFRDDGHFKHIPPMLHNVGNIYSQKDPHLSKNDKHQKIPKNHPILPWEISNTTSCLILNTNTGHAIHTEKTKNKRLSTIYCIHYPAFSENLPCPFPLHIYFSATQHKHLFRITLKASKNSFMKMHANNYSFLGILYLLFKSTPTQLQYFFPLSFCLVVMLSFQAYLH